MEIQWVNRDNIKINAEYADLLPPLAAWDRDKLKTSMQSGYQEWHPIELNIDGEILDGHSRVNIARELDINLLPVVYLSFASKEDEADYAVRTNLSRRQLSFQEKMLLFQKLLKIHPHWAPSRAGEMAGISAPTAIKHAKEVEPNREVVAVRGEVRPSSYQKANLTVKMDTVTDAEKQDLARLSRNNVDVTVEDLDIVGIVPGILKTKTTNTLQGKMGDGKSELLLIMAEQIAVGEDLVCIFANNKKSKVLFTTFEEADIDSLENKRRYDSKENLKIVSFRGKICNLKTFQAFITAHNDTPVVMIDSFEAMHRTLFGKEESTEYSLSPNEVEKVIDFLDSIAISLNKCVIIVRHLDQYSKVYGSDRPEKLAETNIKIETNNGKFVRKITVVKARSGPDYHKEEYYIEWNKDTRLYCAYNKKKSSTSTRQEKPRLKDFLPKGDVGKIVLHDFDVVLTNNGNLSYEMRKKDGSLINYGYPPYYYNAVLSRSREIIEQFRVEE